MYNYLLYLNILAFCWERTVRVLATLWEEVRPRPEDAQKVHIHELPQTMRKKLNK